MLAYLTVYRFGSASDEHFIRIMTEFNKNAWLVFKNLAKDFLGNMRVENYIKNIQQLLEGFKMFGCNIKNICIFHLDDFLENLAAANDEQDSDSTKI